MLHWIWAVSYTHLDVYKRQECCLFIRLFFLFRQVVPIFRHFLVGLVFEKQAALPPCVAKINQFADKGAFPCLSATDGRKVQGLLGYLEFAFVPVSYTHLFLSFAGRALRGYERRERGHCTKIEARGI